MSRSGYSDDCDGFDLIRWRGQVQSAIRGSRGQAFLREMLAALDAMPDKRLIPHDLVDDAGEVCALGAVGRARGIDMEDMDPCEHETMASVFGIAHQLIQEIEFHNDDVGSSPEHRWEWMRQWVVQQIIVKPEELLP